MLRVDLVGFFRTDEHEGGEMEKVEERQVADQKPKLDLQQGFGAIKEIILNGRVDYFVQLFQKPNIISGLLTKREYIFQYVPKQFVEALVIVCLIGFCVLLIALNRTSVEVLTMLGLLATAGFRLEFQASAEFSETYNRFRIRLGFRKAGIAGANDDDEPILSRINSKKRLILTFKIA